jgi:hypothetical protein
MTYGSTMKPWTRWKNLGSGWRETRTNHHLSTPENRRQILSLVSLVTVKKRNKDIGGETD